MSLLTRLGPSKLVPGAKGVFITRALKKFTPIEVAPSVDAIAPPYMVNLIRTPLHTISLRRFLALRHQFSTGMYFNLATAGGWYLIVPSSYAPLADAAGLLAWRGRHHHRYARGTARGGNKVKKKYILLSETATAPSKAADSHCAFGLSTTTAPGEKDGEMASAGGEKGKEKEEDVARTAPSCGSRPLVSSLITIPEEHFFEINDGVFWQMPPADDLASAEYWGLHSKRMQIYEDTSLGADQEEFFYGQQGIVGEELSERERHLQQQRLFFALTRKANVRLSVDDDTQLLTLVPIVDLREGDELLLHYGREWWSQRLLSSLFMSVADEDIDSVRWIERLFAKPTDVFRPFPLLCSSVAVRRKTRRFGEGEKEKENNAMCFAENVNGVTSDLLLKEKHAKVVLCNMVTRCRATDAEALVFAVRRSCVDQQFFSSLVGLRGAGVFDVMRCDDEVPLCHLRRLLLQSLRQGLMTTDVFDMKQQQQREEEEGDAECGSIVI